MIRVGVIGLGNIFNLAYSRVLPRVERFKVVAVSDILPERASQGAKKFQLKTFYTDPIKMLESENLDLVIICTPTYTHANLAIEALRRGVNVITEKPISHKPQLASQMIAESEKAGKYLLVGHTRRFDPRWLIVKHKIESGQLGKILFIRRVERAYLPMPPDSWHWDLERGGGVHLDVGIHSVDMLNWLLDEKPVRAYLQVKNVRKESVDRGGYDWASFWLEYPNGTTCSIEVSWCHPPVYGYYSLLEVVGTKGKVIFDDMDSPGLLIKESGIFKVRYSPLSSAPIEAFQSELEHFADVILKGIKPRITSQEALCALKIIHEAKLIEL